MHGLQGSS
jgi:hypothetical protein